VRFFKQFTGGGYMPSPPASYRESIFRHYFGLYERTVGVCAKVTFAGLSDGDYVELADASSHCTISAIIAWIQKVLYDCSVPRETPMKIGMSHLATFLHSAQGAPHISMANMEDMENKWTIACGKGLIASSRRKHVPPGVTGRKRGAPLFGDKPAPVKVGSNKVTGFTKDGAHLRGVKDLLNNNKKHKAK
jgi:hypothetical protein